MAAHLFLNEKVGEFVDLRELAKIIVKKEELLNPQTLL